MPINSINLNRGNVVLNHFEKGKKVPIGTISSHGGIKMKKVGDKKWIPVSDGNRGNRNSKQKQVQEIIKSKSSKAEKARKLSDLGVKTSVIAQTLDMNYSHAYSTVKKHKEKRMTFSGFFIDEIILNKPGVTEELNSLDVEWSKVAEDEIRIDSASSKGIKDFEKWLSLNGWTEHEASMIMIEHKTHIQND